MKSGYDLFAFSVFYEVLEMCCLIYFENERVIVIKQSIMVLPRAFTDNRYIVKTSNEFQ